MTRRIGSRETKREERKLSQIQEKSFGIVLLGLLFIVGPAFVTSPVIRHGLGPIRTMGWYCMLGGLAVVIGIQVVMRRAANSGMGSSPTKQFFTRDSKPARPSRTSTAPSSSSTPRADAVAAEVFAEARAQTPKAKQEPPIRPTAWTTEVFDVIEWRRFEALCERLFAQAGFETKALSHGADEGIDIWLYSKREPDVAASLVQCKCWGSRLVKVAEVRALLGSMAAKKVKRGVFATTSRFTTDAAQFCRENGIHMLDRAGLLDLIAKRSPEQQQELLAVATEGEFWVPTCASCGVKMVRRAPKTGGKAFWGCVKFPKCRNVIND